MAKQSKRYIEISKEIKSTEYNPDAVSYTHLPSPRDMRRSRMPSSA